MFNNLYEEVRNLGLPYKIDESGGSLIIKISLNIKQKQSQQNKEKFRFNITRTFNGSGNLNWKAPQTYKEDFMNTRTSFPDIDFFRKTPPPLLAKASPYSVPLCSTSPRTAPPRTAPPSCTALPSSSAPPPLVAASAYPGPTSTSILQSDSTKETTPVESLTSLESPLLTNTYQANHLLIMSTPINPYRCSRRHIVFPKIPNLLNPSSSVLSVPESPSSSTSFALDLSCETINYADEAMKYEEFIKVMQAFYEQKCFKVIYIVD